MRSFLKTLSLIALSTTAAFAAPLSGNARQALPYDIQQIIQVDYQVLNSSPTALALKERLMPEQLKSLEQALKKAGFHDTDDVDNVTFALFRGKGGALGLVGVAQGNIPTQRLTLNLKKQKYKPVKYQQMDIYPLANGMSFSMLDPSTMLFGETGSVKQALDAYAGEKRNVNYNNAILDQLAAVQSEPIWSILDAAGTQNMIRSALGDAAGLADYETVKKRLLGSHYTMDFGNNVKFNLDVKSSDSFTAATLSSLMKAGAMYKKMSGSAAEKAAVESLTVDSSGSDLLLKFEADNRKFVSLLNSPMFQSISR
jgi:hypothetical protein